MVVQVDPEILAKTGQELFKELLRVYNVAEVEDYFKMGQWRDDLMKTDLQLLYQHNREAGADDPTPLDDVKLPEMPKVAASGFPLGMGAARPAGVPAGVPAVRTMAPTPTPVAGVGTAPAATSAGGSMVAELRLIAMFVGKWKLDPARTKMMLAKLPPLRRRYVMQKFTDAGGATPELRTKALAAFIAKCEQTGEWGTMQAGAAAVVGPKATVPRPAGVRPNPLGLGAMRTSPAMTSIGGGIKRPLTPSPGMPTQMAKRPFTMVPKVGGAARPLNAAMRPTGMRPTQGVRPMVPKAGGGGLIRGMLQRF